MTTKPRPAPDNRTWWIADNLDVLRGMNSESVDLIYLDPPFKPSSNYAVPISTSEAQAAMKETWGLSELDWGWYGFLQRTAPALHDFLNSVVKLHSKSLRAYLVYMSPRLTELHRVLKETGTVYVHCDPHASHYLKLLLDHIFGSRNYRNEIVWLYSGGGVPRKDFPRKHDVLLRYTKSDSWTFNVERKPFKANTQQVGKHSTLSDGDIDIDLERGTPVTDWWTDVPTVTGWSPENVSFRTQKPLALLRRVIATSSQPGDVVLDPFCGSGTACVAAEELKRQWLGIDIATPAANVAKSRLTLGAGLRAGQLTVTKRPPTRTDDGEPVKLKDRKVRAVTMHELAEEQAGRCAGCENHYDLKDFTVDHKLPKTKGGTDHRANLQLLCHNCNSLKGTGTMEGLYVKLHEAGIRTLSL